MNIAICHTYLYLMGGGERVALTIASELSKYGHNVNLYGITDRDIAFFEKYYGIKLNGIKLHNHFGFLSFLKYIPIYKNYIIPRMLSKSDYDMIIDTSSNGLFFIRSRAMLLCYVHYQLEIVRNKIVQLLLYPFTKQIGYNYDNYDLIMCNSSFTKTIIEGTTSKDIHILVPPVMIDGTIPNDKEKIICSIGRIEPEKKFEILIESFKLISASYPDWKLIIAGSCNNYKYLHKLQNICAGLPIELYSNITQESLNKIYDMASIYWHSKGYDTEKKSKYEHFGITTVEAMSHGCIPVVINKGGQKEIIDQGINGYRWDNVKELISYTKTIIDNTDTVNQVLRKNAIDKSRIYDENNFRKNMMSIIKKLDNNID